MTTANGRINLNDPTDVDGVVPPKPNLAQDASARLSDSVVAFKGEHPVPDEEGPLHVVTCDEGWMVRFEGSEEAAAVVPTKKEAMQIARKLGKERDLRIVEHGMDGKIR